MTYSEDGMTYREFLSQMRYLIEKSDGRGDTEYLHQHLDDLLVSFIREIGSGDEDCEAALVLYEDAPKWYA